MKKNVEHDKFGNVYEVKKNGKRKVHTPPNKKINMGGGPFVGRHTTG